MPSESRGIYSIGAVSRILGIAPFTLRAWEKRYRLVVPERGDAGRRLYSGEQLDQLRFVSEQMELGLQPADAHRLLAERLGRDELPAPEPGEQRPLILLAEGDRHVGDLLAHALRSEGYRVEEASSAEEATEKLWQRAPDLAVVDLLVSGGAGAEFCRTLRGRGCRSVLAISALEADDEARGAAADRFLRKPVDPLELVSAVRVLLARREPLP